VNLRSGPGTTFDRLVVLPALSVLPLTGRSADNQWWQVRYAATNQIGWISAGFSTLYGSCGTIPIVGTATNTPVVIPSNTPIVPTNTSAPTVTPGLPDLVVTSIVGANALVLSGGTVTQSYSITLTNTGSGPSGAFQARITSFPPTQTRELNASSLPAGGSISLNVDLTFTSANAYTINVQADSGGSVTEVSEVNNSGQLPVTVTNP
jgi:hypothetical protein